DDPISARVRATGVGVAERGGGTRGGAEVPSAAGGGGGFGLRGGRRLTGTGGIAVGLLVVAGKEVADPARKIDPVGAAPAEDAVTAPAPGAALVFLDVKAHRAFVPVRRAPFFMT